MTKQEMEYIKEREAKEEFITMIGDAINTDRRSGLDRAIYFDKGRDLELMCLTFFDGREKVLINVTGNSNYANLKEIVSEAYLGHSTGKIPQEKARRFFND